MKPVTILFLGLILALSWALPVLSLLDNRSNPNFGTAMGVAYGFAIGSFVHLLLGILWLLIRRSRVRVLEVAVLGLSLVLIIGLTLLADRGALSL